MSDNLVINTAQEAEQVEQEILNKHFRTKEDWAKQEQLLSRYVFATMPEELLLRAVHFAINAMHFVSHSAVAKIVFSQVIRKRDLFRQPMIVQFLERCLNQVLGKHGYLGYDTWGNSYNEEDWRISRRALVFLLQIKDMSFIGQIERIHKRLITGDPIMYPVGGAEAYLTHAEACAAFQAVLEELRRQQ